MSAHVYRRRVHPEVAHHVVVDFDGVMDFLRRHASYSGGSWHPIGETHLMELHFDGQSVTAYIGQVLVVEGGELTAYDLTVFRRWFEIIPEEER